MLAVAWADLVYVKVGEGELTHLVGAKRQEHGRCMGHSDLNFGPVGWAGERGSRAAQMRVAHALYMYCACVYVAPHAGCWARRAVES